MLQALTLVFEGLLKLVAEAFTVRVPELFKDLTNVLTAIVVVVTIIFREVELELSQCLLIILRHRLLHVPGGYRYHLFYWWALRSHRMLAVL